ncbi:hypothetical protein EX895_003929 [Sporisorium graminicola]|uniref:Uncharacterized protein n=1 Tax=Sporisorium graminicola TaxID=280036 RepID=A0A4U7KWD9_9BASI|nr:hypothetical protein EX895_003929 [Sporisorium graminicola]TKY87252.1 hypothetical protein EX895_003929 [Sporisorium graminicola]
MSLFGGRQAKQPSNNSSHSRVGWGLPGASASARNRDEREALISASTGGDDFDDSDAISLLSNIADRDSRRGGGGAAAARRRARARARAQGRTCGTFWFDVEDWTRALSCGLLGRGQSNEDGSAGRQRVASIGSVMSRGARRPNASSSSASVGAASRHSRSLSDASTDSGASLTGSGFAESIDADAGMLDDQAIAQFGQPSPPSREQTDTAAEAEAEPLKARAEDVARAKEEAEAEAAQRQAQAERQAALEAEAARLQQEAEAEAQRQKEEEAWLAAEEDAAIAKARRKAERKAAKAGLLKLQQETQAAQRWRTEAEAEAAAGGFTLADAEADDSHHHDTDREVYAQQQFDYRGADYHAHEGTYGAEFDQYGDADEAEGYYATVQEQGPGGVVHHHHYYHAAPPEAEVEEFVYPVSPHAHGAPVFADATKPPVDEADEATADKTVSEDEADIAGLSFGRKKAGSRRNDSGSASGSRSAAGLTARTTTTGGGSSSGGSGSGHRPTSASSSAAGRTHYRDRPRRHERTSSKSSNSSSGIFSYHSSNTLHPIAAPSTAATSVTSPRVLPNLYESEAIYTSAKPVQGEGADEVAQAQFGKPDVDANEFGVITAGTNKGGAGRVKKSYRDKRGPSQLVDEQAGTDSFEGFPGF